MTDDWIPSTDDLELLSTSDEDVISKFQNFSFDQEDFSKRVRGGDLWQQTIQAHLYFEHVVAQLLKEALAKPEAIAMGRMGFRQRLDLVIAMGLLPDDLVTSIRKISGIRNKIAHDLSFEISESDVRDLENCTPNDLRDAVRAEKERRPGPLELHELLTVILLKTDIVRQELAAIRELRRKSELRLRSVLRKTPGVKYVR